MDIVTKLDILWNEYLEKNQITNDQKTRQQAVKVWLEFEKLNDLLYTTSIEVNPKYTVTSGGTTIKERVNSSNGGYFLYHRSTCSKKFYDKVLEPIHNKLGMDF